MRYLAAQMNLKQSKTKVYDSDVPQGSVLGPELLLKLWENIWQSVTIVYVYRLGEKKRL